jgi:Family of unknown function (DUF5763)
MKNRVRKNRCQALTKDGKPCGAPAMAGGLCFFHANPKKAAQLGRIGGRSHRHGAGALTDPLPKLDTASGVQETISWVVSEVCAGRLDPRVATSIAPLLTLQERMIEITSLQRRVLELEKKLAVGDQAEPLETEVLQTNEPSGPAKPLSHMAPSTA